MTSMPASRRARAITLAPRSWPSRPGLATSTRILRSFAIFSDFIKQLFTTEAQRNPKRVVRPGSPCGKPCTEFISLRGFGSSRSCLPLSSSVPPCLRGGFTLRQLQASPQIPRGVAAIGVPALCDLLHLFGRGQLAFAIGTLNGHADAQIADRQHVGTAQGKDQEHMRGPDADALNVCERRDHLFIAHLR